MIPFGLNRQLPLLSDVLTVRRHIEQAVEWILTARKHSKDGGIPAHFNLLRWRWSPSYPEITGYTIPTLFSCAVYLQKSELHSIAVSMADYLLAVQTSEGGVGHWSKRNARNAAPIVFDTGQVIFGWIAAWKETNRSDYLDAAIKAADWLVSVQDASGAWTQSQHLGTVKVIDTRVAWALLMLERIVSRTSYREAARKNLEWAIAQQEPNGFFHKAAFRVGDDPFTHTIAYTAEGFLECGLELDEPRYIAAAEKTVRALLELQRPDGSLASTYNANWQPTSRSSCLTGNSQMALLWLGFYNLSKDAQYLKAAHKAIAFVASTQNFRAPNANIRGAIAGSYPIYGRYERFKYPSWATKFFIDALLAYHYIALSNANPSSWNLRHG